MTQTTDPVRVEELKTEIAALEERLAAARKELLDERFKGVFRYERGTVVLVPRMLFGKVKMWPARIVGVHLEYGSGIADGKPWENKVVSYSVFLQQKDGEFGGSSEGFWHKDVVLRPEVQA